MLLVRPAELPDAPAISRVHTAAWQSAYRGIVPQAHLDSLNPVSRIAKWERDILAEQPQIWVGERNGQVLGWVSFGPNRDPDATSELGEIWALYVAPEAQGTGIGRALWEAAEAQLKGLGYLYVTLWVLTLNESARRFYGHLGFHKDEVPPQTFTILDEPIEEVRYRRPLSPSP